MNKFATFFLNKNTLFVFLLFLLFFPIQSQYNNLLIYLFDQLATNGQISKLFTFSYTGDLIGCVEVSEMYEIEKSVGFFQKQKNGMQLSFLTISVLTWILLWKRHKNERSLGYVGWLLLFVFSFYLHTAIDFLLIAVANFDLKWIQGLLVMFICCLVVVFLGIYLFLRILNKEEKIKIIMIACPASIVSMIIWSMYLGPMLLPLITK